MSLGKRSLRKHPVIEVPLEEKLQTLEKNIKSRRGTNRRAAFDALRTADDSRALALVESLVKGAEGKNRVDLGALLASTAIPRFVDAAARGRYGDVAVHEHVKSEVLRPAIAELARRIGTLPPAEVERRARALGLVPLVRAAHVLESDLALAALVDDDRLTLSFRKLGASAMLELAPQAVWSRKGRAGVDDDLVLTAGLATRYVAGDAFDVGAFLRALSPLSPAERTARLHAARLPGSARGFPAGKQVALLTAVLDDDGVDVVYREAAATALAQLDVPEAIEALLARPLAHFPATLVACASVPVAEALAIIGPLVRTNERVRDALVTTPSLAGDPGLIDDVTSVLASDPFGAMSLLGSSRSPRAAQEIEAAFASVNDVDAGPLLLGFISRDNPRRVRAELVRFDLEGALEFAAGALQRTRDKRLAGVLRQLLPRAGRSTPLVVDALSYVD